MTSYSASLRLKEWVVDVAAKAKLTPASRPSDLGVVGSQHERPKAHDQLAATNQRITFAEIVWEPRDWL